MMFFDFFVFRSTVNASFSYHTAKPNMHTHSEIKYQLHQLLQSPQDICSGVHCVYYLPQTCCASAAAESNQTVILFIEALVLDLSTFTKIFYIFRYIDACDIFDLTKHSANLYPLPISFSQVPSKQSKAVLVKKNTQHCAFSV